MSEFRGHILVTGGMGYIGSHTCVLLVAAGWRVTIIDNLANSNAECLARVNRITGRPDAVAFEQCDLRDRAALARIFGAARAAAPADRAPFDATIHFAAFKAVGESREKPLEYYDNNVSGSVALLQTMAAHDCKRIIFSSSCTVYGEAESPLSEQSAAGQGLTNAYATTKWMMETILRDLQRCDPAWSVVILRYFNPVGAHPSGLIGEDPRGVPNCLLPFMLQVLVGRRERLTVNGNDYPTRDGTCVRDYIHVMDVAQGHIDAMEWLAKQLVRQGAPPGLCDVFNFGTGNGTTVLELMHAMERAAGKPVVHVIGPRRAGDLAMAYANPSKAASELGWSCKNSLDDICRDSWKWASENPFGYDSKAV
jgi:UDP-glucose 4-epimerase